MPDGSNTGAKPTSELHRTALGYIADGVPVFPCLQGGKRPATEHGFQDATTEPARIEAWWAENPAYNLALEPARAGWCVVDIDPEGIPWAKERMATGELPPTFTVRTPRGGRHLYYAGTLPPSASKLAPGVDTRGEGSYVLVPPSVTADGAYTILDDAEPAPLPGWIADALAKRRHDPVRTGTVSEAVLNHPHNIARARAIMDRTPGAIEGQGSDDATIKLANLMLDHTSPERVLELLAVHWVSRCEGDWDPDHAWLAEKVANAVSSRQNEIGCYAVDEWDPEIVRKALAANAAPKPSGDADTSGQNAEPQEVSLRSLIIRPSIWIKNPPPDPQWLIPGWLPTGAAALLYGRPGAGKTIWCQMLMTAGAIGAPLLGLQPAEPFRSFGLFTEDRDRSLHYRQRHHCAAFGTNLQAIEDGGVQMLSAVGRDVTLMTFTRDGTPELTRQFHELTEIVLDHRARLLVLDTAARVFGGNENVRREVTAFLGIACTQLAMRMNGTVLVCAHPSRAGEREGNEGSSTAWRGSARSLLLLGHPPTKHPLHGNKAARLLTLDKANDAPAGKTLALRLDDVVFSRVCVETEAQTQQRVLFATIKQAVERGDNLSADSHATNYAPRVLTDQVALPVETLAAALGRLQMVGHLSVELYKNSQRRTAERLVVTDAGRAWLAETEELLSAPVVDPDGDDNL